MELENVIKLINAVSESSLTSFSMEDGDTKLSLGADRSDRAAVKETAGADDIVNSDNGNESGLNKSDIKTSDDNVLTVNSPLVGVFYSSASPEADAYVAIGDRVKKGQVIGIVEAMKLMNEIESDYDGILCEYDLLIASQFLIYYIGKTMDIDVSKPNYSEAAMKIYFYKGNL